MMHDKRVFCVSEVEGIPELADKLANHCWTVCTGFHLGEYTYLNDSTSENGAQEYVVVKDGRQIESITFGWMKEPEILDCLLRVELGKYDHSDWTFPTITNRLEAPGEHHCRACA